MKKLLWLTNEAPAHLRWRTNEHGYLISHRGVAWELEIRHGARIRRATFGHES